MKNDITAYGDQELELWCQNDESLYRLYEHCVENDDFNRLLSELEEHFVFTQNQKNSLYLQFCDDVEIFQQEENQ